MLIYQWMEWGNQFSDKPIFCVSFLEAWVWSDAKCFCLEGWLKSNVLSSLCLGASAVELTASFFCSKWWCHENAPLCLESFTRKSATPFPVDISFPSLCRLGPHNVHVSLPQEFVTPWLVVSRLGVDDVTEVSIPFIFRPFSKHTNKKSSLASLWFQNSRNPFRFLGVARNGALLPEPEIET